MIKAFEDANGCQVPYRIAAGSLGAIATCCGDPVMAGRELGWTAKRGLTEMMRDAWRWQSRNPTGYGS